MRFSEHAAKGTAKEKISSPLVRAGIRSSGVAAISADCSQQGTRIEVTLETHAQVLQASILSCNPPRSAAGPGPVVRSTAPYRSACVRHSAHNTNRRGRRVFLPWGFHRDGGARTRGFQGRETVAGAVECAANQTMRSYSLCHMHASLGPGAGAGLHRDFDVLSQQQQEAHQPLQRESGETPAKKG